MADEKVAKTPRELSVKEAIYAKIGDVVKDKTGKRIGRTGGREIFDLVVTEVFTAAVREGTLRFNGGFGSLHKRTYKAGKRRLPSGAETVFGERQKMRYEEGVSVKALVASGGATGTAAPAEVPTTDAPAEAESVDLD